MNPEQTKTVQQWNSLVTEKVNTAIGSILDGNFIAANYPAGFNYGVKQQYYNPDTLSTLDTLIKTGDEISSLGDKFSVLYKNVIDNIKYDFSQADQQLMHDEQTKQNALVGKIINEYKNAQLDDEPEEYPSIPFIMQRIKEVTGADFLHLDTKLYPYCAPLCVSLSNYAKLATNTMKLQNQWSVADDRLRAIATNITTPTPENGGLKTSASNVMIGWDKIPESAELMDSLKGNKSIMLSMQADNFSQTKSSLHIEGKTSVSVPFSWAFSVTASNHTTYDLSKFAQSGASMSISIKYNGITLLAAIPTNLSINYAKGWFAPDVLNEAAGKSGKDETGYQLNGHEYNPASLFGDKGTLRRMKTFVISQQPTISLHMSKFDFSQMRSFLSVKSKVNISLFGIFSIGGASNDYSVSRYEENSSAQSLDVTFEPGPLGGSSSIEKQTAFIIGGVADTYK